MLPYTACVINTAAMTQHHWKAAIVDQLHNPLLLWDADGLGPRLGLFLSQTRIQHGKIAAAPPGHYHTRRCAPRRRKCDPKTTISGEKGDLLRLPLPASGPHLKARVAAS